MENKATSWRLNASGGLTPNDGKGARAQPLFRSERSSHCAFHRESSAVHEADRLDCYESFLTSANRMEIDSVSITRAIISYEIPSLS